MSTTPTKKPWTILIYMIAFVSSLILAGCQTCVPYAPDNGLFLNSGVTFNRVTASSTTVGSYSISLSNQQVVVISANNTMVAQVSVPSGMDAYYLFYGTNNRFLALDFHTTPSTPPPISRDFKQVVVDLLSGQPQGNSLPQVTKLGNPQLNIYPSPGNGLAFFVWYGLGSGQVEDAGIYRSDNGAQLCFKSPFTASIQVISKVTPTSVQILDGGSVKQDCPLPRGLLDISPPSQSFGTILANSTATRNFTFRNTGNDCCVVSTISSSPHFQVSNPNNVPSFALGPNDSQAVTVQFNPNGAVGTFSETLNVTRNPANGADKLVVSGVSISPVPHLTVKKILRPPADPGKFNLQIDGVVKAANVGDGGSTGAQVMIVGSHTVAETAGTGTNLANYTTTIGGDCAANGNVTLAAGDDKTCTITNAGPPRLSVRKILRPPADPGKFNLQIDGAAKATNVGDGGSTGAQVMTVGSHAVGETAVTGTNLSNYATTIGGACAANGSVTLAAGDDKTCTITNAAQFDSATVTVTSFPGSMQTGSTGTACVDAHNDGTTTWDTTNYLLKLWQLRVVSLPRNTVALSAPVAPGQTAHLCFDVKCNSYGTGGFAAQMSGMHSGQFGQSNGGTIVCQ